jgi:hypothetical protein
VALAALIAVGLAVVTARSGFEPATLAGYRAGVSSSPDVREVVELTADRLAAYRKSVLAGTWNGLPPALVEWELRRRHRSGAELRLPVPAKKIARRVESPDYADRLHRRSDVDGIVILAMDPGDRDRAYREEVGWVDSLVSTLRCDLRFFQPESVRVTNGYALWQYRRAGERR